MNIGAADSQNALKSLIGILGLEPDATDTDIFAAVADLLQFRNAAKKDEEIYANSSVSARERAMLSRTGASPRAYVALREAIAQKSPLGARGGARKNPGGVWRGGRAR